ncbi:MAG: hypothetical protein BWY68_00859 [bacterium ADurb.Bin400]|nr:MAG: hypothetical protein BWY68_00859 [bacterium ADurb.Bin400]
MVLIFKLLGNLPTEFWPAVTYIQRKAAREKQMSLTVRLFVILLNIVITKSYYLFIFIVSISHQTNQAVF